MFRNDSRKSKLYLQRNEEQFRFREVTLECLETTVVNLNCIYKGMKSSLDSGNNYWH
jgi:hypothetical protein